MLYRLSFLCSTGDEPLIRSVAVFFIVFCWSFKASSSLYCKYSCDTNKGRKAALEFLSTKKISFKNCLSKCSARDLVPFFCEFFSLTFNEETDPLSEASQKLMTLLMTTPHDNLKPLSWENNYAYHVLKTISPSVCMDHQTVVSTALSEERQDSAMQTFKRFLSHMNASLKKRYLTLKEYWTEAKKKVQNLPDVKDCDAKLTRKNPVMRLFNWCYNYCSGERAPKTFKDLEEFIQESKGLNPGVLVDKLKSSPTPFTRKKHDHARRLYKCLTQCSLKHTERYLCTLIDEVDLLDKEKGDTPKKMLDMIGQILLMVHPSSDNEEEESKLAIYVKNPDYMARCSRMFQDLYYRGYNYQINIDYLKKAYGVE
jgi:hypothetical protein